MLFARHAFNRRLLLTGSLKDATLTAAVAYTHSPATSLHALASVRRDSTEQVLIGASQVIGDEVRVSATLNILDPRASLFSLSWRGLEISTVGTLDAFFVGYKYH